AGMREYEGCRRLPPYWHPANGRVLWDAGHKRTGLGKTADEVQGSVNLSQEFNAKSGTLLFVHKAASASSTEASGSVRNRCIIVSTKGVQYGCERHPRIPPR